MADETAEKKGTEDVCCRPGTWEVTVIFLGICCGLLVIALLVGISENVPGLALCYAASTALVLAFVHGLRRWYQFGILAGASLVGFPVFVVLHNLLYALAEGAVDIVVVDHLFDLLHVAAFLVAIFLCPAGLLVGLLGMLVVLFGGWNAGAAANCEEGAA